MTRFSLLRRHPPSSRIFPYTTLFRSIPVARGVPPTRCSGIGEAPGLLVGDAVGVGINGLLAADRLGDDGHAGVIGEDRKSTRLNSSHMSSSYAVFCLKKKKLSAWLVR